MFNKRSLIVFWIGLAASSSAPGVSADDSDQLPPAFRNGVRSISKTLGNLSEQYVKPVEDAVSEIAMVHGRRNARHLADWSRNKNRNRFEGRLNCIYGDPVYGKHCPPVMEDPMAHLKQNKAPKIVAEEEVMFLCDNREF